MGIFVAGLSFGLLTSETAGSRLRVSRTVSQNFRSAYDILVRPRGATSSFERKHHLVNDGFLAGLFGGITMQQYHEIARIPGVSLAAPVANVGYFLVSTQLFVPFPRNVPRHDGVVYRIGLNWDVHHGLARYPGATSYVYYTDHELLFTGPETGMQSGVGSGSRNVCGGFVESSQPAARKHSGLIVITIGKAVRNPYTESLSPQFFCSSPRLSFARGVRTFASSTDAELGGRLGAEVTFDFPVLIAGVDPTAEERLVGLRGAVISGRYLRDGEGLSKPGPTPGLTDGRPFTRTYPVLASIDTFLDEAAQLQVSELQLPSGRRLASLLASSHAYADITHAHSGRTLWATAVSPTRAWRTMLRGFQKDARLDFSPAYWRVGAAHYSLSHGAKLSVTPKPVANTPSVWSDTSSTSEDIGGSFAPPGSGDVWYRTLRAFGASGNALPHGPRTFLTPEPKLVGTFDPSRLRGFSPLSKVPLQTFFPPEATGADATTRRLLRGTALGPTTNLGGYLSQPPLLLTTLAGAIALENGNGESYTEKIPHGTVRVQAYAGASPKAPISSIQVRVAGVTGPNKLSLAKINLIAEEIAQRTGLSVNVTAGSSPTEVGVRLGRGRYGTPPLDLQQQWVKEDVDSAILQAESTKDLALLALVGLTCALFVAATTYAGVRERRREIAILGTLGWPGTAIFQLIVGEAAQAGTLAGLAATGAAVMLGAIGSLHQPALALGLITPAALLLAILAAGVPARLASNTMPVEGLRGPAMPVGRRHRVRSLSGLALVSLMRVPGRTLLGAATLAAAVAATSSLIGVEIAFRGAVAHDLLGDAVTVYVRGADIASVVLVAFVGGACVANIVHSGMRERRTELATLEATGWSTRDIARLAGLEGLAVGATGSLLGAVVGSGIVGLLGGSPSAVIATAGAAVVTGIAVSMLALIVPITLRSHPPMRDGLAVGGD